MFLCFYNQPASDYFHISFLKRMIQQRSCHLLYSEKHLSVSFRCQSRYLFRKTAKLKSKVCLHLFLWLPVITIWGLRRTVLGLKNNKIKNSILLWHTCTNQLHVCHSNMLFFFLLFFKPVWRWKWKMRFIQNLFLVMILTAKGI